MGNTKKKVFYGWFILIALWLLMAVTMGLCNNTMSQFLKPMCEALSISRTSYSLLISTITVTALCIYPVVGGLLNKYRKGWLIRGSALLVVVGFIGLSFVENTTGMYAMGVIMGVGTAFTNICMINILLNNWFHAKKGFVMGLVSTGSGVGSAVFNPLANALIVSSGYQTAFRVLGLAALALMLPILLLYKFAPEDIGLLPYGLEGNGVSGGENSKKNAPAAVCGMTRVQAMKTPKFYILFFICVALVVGVMGIWFHISAYLTDLGYSPAKAASIISVISIVLAVSKLFFGWLNDRIGTYKNFLVFTLLSTVGIFLTLQFGNAQLAILCAVMFGITFSEPNVMAQLITVHAFGSKHFQDIFSIISMAVNLGGVIAGPISGTIYEKTGSYSRAIVLYGFLYVIIFVLGFITLRKGYSESVDKQ